MRHDALLYRALEQETVGTICAVSYNSAQRRHQRVREILGNILRAEVAHIKAQSLFHEFVSVFAVAFFQPTIHLSARFWIKPDGHLFF